MKTTKLIFDISSEKSLDSCVSQVFRLLIKMNEENCIYKYKYCIFIYSNNLTFKDIGEVIPTENNSFFKDRDIPLSISYGIHPKTREQYSTCKGIDIYFDNIKFYKRFRNFQLTSVKIQSRVKESLITLRAKGVTKLEVNIDLSYR